MNRERIEILMNRSLDGAASREDREELARALRADPLLKSEFEELTGAHNSLNSLFTKLALPRDFSKRVMKRIQPHSVPSDVHVAAVEAAAETAPLIQLPLRRSSRMQVAGVPAGRKSGRLIPMFVTMGAVSMAAALLLAIGLLTGIIGSHNAPMADKGTELQAEGRGGVPSVSGHHRTDPGVSPLEREASDGSKKPSEASPGLPKSEPAPAKRDGLVNNNGSDTPKPEVRVTPEPAPEDPTPDEPVVPAPENPQPKDPSEEPRNGVVEKPVSPEPGPTSTREVMTCGTLTILNKGGKVEFLAADGKWIAVMNGADIAVGAKLRTSASSTALLHLAYGMVVLGKDSYIKLLEQPNRFELVKGEVTLERGRNDAGENEALEAVLDGSTLRLMQGTTVIERRGGVTGKKAEIHQVIGGCSLMRGAEAVDVGNGQMIAVTEGRAFDKPVSKSYVLEAWAGDGRAEVVVETVKELLDARKENKNSQLLSGVLGDLLRLELSGDLTTLFLQSVLSKQSMSSEVPKDCFKVGELLTMLKTVEGAMAEQKSRPKADVTFDVIMEYAVAALENAETVAQWQDAFKGLRNGPTVEAPKKASEKMQRKNYAPKPLAKAGMGG